MSHRGVVFVSSDWISDVVVEAIEEVGCEIVRGPRNPPPGGPGKTVEEWPESFARADILVVSPIAECSRAMMESAPRLRAVVSPVIGVETIDVAAASDAAILVAHGATSENFTSMAEATVMSIAALSLDLHAKERILRDNQPRPRVLRSRSLRGRVVGLIGLGRIGRAVAQRLSGWEMSVQAFDPYVKQEDAPPGVSMVDLDTLLQSSDFVSVHVTVTEETRKIIGERELRLMKPDAFFINNSRGAAVEEAAVQRVLADGAIAGAALDTFEIEPLPTDSPLRDLPDVILTPHIIGHTKDVLDSLAPAAAENVRRILDGEPPLFSVNPDIIPRWHDRLKTIEN